MNIQNITVGEVLGETQFYKVQSIDNSSLTLLTDSGQSIKVSKQYAEKLLSSASQFNEVVKLTRTEIQEKFMSSARTPITVNYNKQANPADIKKSITELYPNKGGKLMSQSDFSKAVSKFVNLKGEERTIIGRHYGVQDINGRVHFIDMEINRDPSKSYDNRQRLVDPRTINFIIVDNIKYEVRK